MLACLNLLPHLQCVCKNSASILKASPETFVGTANDIGDEQTADWYY